MDDELNELEYESSSEESVGSEEVVEPPVYVYNNELTVVDLQANKKKRKLSTSMHVGKMRGKLTQSYRIPIYFSPCTIF